MADLIHNHPCILQAFQNILEQQEYIVMGLDFGKKRMGIALYHSLIERALPVGIDTNTIVDLKIAAVVELCSKYNIQGIVLGMPADNVVEKLEDAAINHHRRHPHRPSNNRTSIVRDVEAFAQLLRKAIPKCPLAISDEHLTTFMAKGILSEIQQQQHRTRRRRIRDEDSIAAAIIVEEFVNCLKERRGQDLIGNKT